MVRVVAQTASAPAAHALSAPRRRMRSRKTWPRLSAAKTSSAPGAPVRAISRQLRDQERIAAGHRVRPLDQLLLDRAAERDGQAGAHPVRGERARAQGDAGRVGRELGERRPAAGLGAAREGDRQGEPVAPAGHVGQREHGLLVAPVRVVHHQGERSRGGQVRDQPVNPVECGLEADRAAAQVGQQPEGVRRRTGARGRACGGVQPGHLALEQRPHHPIGEVALELPRPRHQHVHPLLRGQRGEHPEHRALADAGRAVDHDQGSRAGDRRRDRPSEGAPLVLALDHHRRAAHGWDAPSSIAAETAP